MGRYKRGDFVKVEIPAEATRESEWMWVLVDDSDDRQRLVFGTLDNEPLVNTDLRVGMKLAVSYDNVREHRSADSFAQ
jgi:uncharacterized protein YegJ (DUF2314 family)